MPACPIGTTWAAGSWEDTAWECNSWADAVPPPPGGNQVPQPTRYRYRFTVRDMWKASIWLLWIWS